MVRLRARLRVISMIVSATALLATVQHPPPALGRPAPVSAAAQCPTPTADISGSVAAGRTYIAQAYQALIDDRANLARLGPQLCSVALSIVAERHTAYMVSIGGWSDGDPAGSVLSRVRGMGIDATFSGQNVVTAQGATIASAIRQGEAFFAREANGGGPHWDNITNPNHHYMGLGLAVLGSAGSYTIYLTQVFADADSAPGVYPSSRQGAAVTPGTTNPTQASFVAQPLKVSAIAHATTRLMLRTAPLGAVIGVLHPRDRLLIVDLQYGWAQVRVLRTNVYGWAFAGFLVPVSE